MSQITVQFGALQQGADTLKLTHAKLESQFRDLEAAMAPLLGTWSGDAKEQYYGCQKQWTEAATRIGEVVNQLRGAVERSGEMMRATEQSNVNLFG
ncbi:hypothetical protein GCM10027290_62250 [Micromonospora sonneratiae]|uniref:ESAT-6-like protein n=1 Tax=Micromonospora sonneratiae TaxID=1184706 RepID=A0ABW3YFW3_9ACTN